MTEERGNERTYLREASIKLRKRRVKDGTPVGEPMTDPDQVYELFSDLQNEGKEKLIVIALDIKLKIICFEVVAVGSVRAAYAKPAEIIRVPIAMGAEAIVLVHNHPSGDPTPSKA
ncbi:JAB domain-containing protein, partial [Puniceicoccaceae bacterium K14]|nr:JAB domain-containing protein [Puniceicoccaceae bacterium K14]